MRTALEPRQHSPEPAPLRDIPSSLLALAAVASRLGLDLSVEQLMRRFALEPGEPDTATLIAIAREVGLEAQTLNMRFDELPRLARALPAILRAKDGGALILEAAHSDPAKGTVVVIRDPKEAEDALVAIDELHLAEVWMGEAILVKRRYAISDEQQPFGGKWLFGQVMRERTIFKQVGLAAFVSTIFALAPPFAFMITINRVLPNTSYSTLGVIAGGLVIMMVFETILNHVRRILTQVVSTRVDGRLGLYIMEKVLRLPMDYFEHNPTGRIIEKLGSVWLIRHFLTGQLFGAFLDAVPLLGLIPAMLLLNWQLALIAFGLSGIIFVVVLVFMKPMHRLYHKVIMAEQAKSSHLVETLHGIRTIKSLSLEGRRRKEWDRLVASVTETRHAFGLLANYPQTIITPLERLIYSGSFVVGAYLVLNAQSVTSPVTTTTTLLPGAINLPAITNLQSAGGLVAFVMLASRLAAPLVQLASLQRDLAEVRMALGQIGQVVNVPPEESRANGTRLPVKGEVSFKDVCFRYAPGAPYALEDVNITVPAGTNLGIMGRSGSGKTTITRLLQRLNQSYEGMIKIDGVDLREMDLMHLRTHIGVVPQENFLFSGTIRENIAMARPEASFGDVIKAAQLSGAEEFIERQPRGYDTMLEEGATNLSGGQRQRLALARALLIDPPILILDEATSALDAESEAIVSANLKRMAKGRTVLSISHRLSMLVECDAILVLERGRVYDLGTHEELVRRCDIYKHMWFQQNRHLDPSLADKPLVVARGAAR